MPKKGEIAKPPEPSWTPLIGPRWRRDGGAVVRQSDRGAGAPRAARGPGRHVPELGRSASCRPWGFAHVGDRASAADRWGFWHSGLVDCSLAPRALEVARCVHHRVGFGSGSEERTQWLTEARARESNGDDRAARARGPGRLRPDELSQASAPDWASLSTMSRASRYEEGSDRGAFHPAAESVAVCG